MKLGPMMIKVIEQNSRVYWDLYIFVIIVIAAFEIPYDLLIDFEDKSIGNFFSYLFLFSFGVDMLLNCITVQSIKGNGWLGIRKLLPKDFFTTACEMDSNNNVQVVRQFPKTMSAYLTSWWFIVDFLAIFPFEWLFSAYSSLNMTRTLRLSRLPRIIRAIRAIRAVKAVKAFNSVDNVFRLNPSLGRFVLLCVLVPWLMHIFACVISYYESVIGGAQYTYFQAFKQIFITFTTNNMMIVNTTGGQVTATVSVLTGYLFFGLLMGNFVTFFSQIDTRKATLEGKINQWKHFFKTYPQIFTKKTQKRILLLEENNVQNETNLRLTELIISLDDESLRNELIMATKHIR